MNPTRWPSYLSRFLRWLRVPIRTVLALTQRSAIFGERLLFELETFSSSSAPYGEAIRHIDFGRGLFLVRHTLRSWTHDLACLLLLLTLE